MQLEQFGATAPRELTARQKELLEHIACIVAQGRSPLTCELREAMQVSRESSLTDLLRPLERKGYVRIEGGVRGRQRIIELTLRGRVAMALGAPVVGSVTAGPLREALCEADEVVSTLGEAVGFRPGDFLLRVQGDSMIGDGICDGDKVLLRPNVEVQQGEIAAVQIMHEDQAWETTLKHVYLHLDEAGSGEGVVELCASNPRYAPVRVDSGLVSIAGVYRGLMRAHPGAGA